MQYCDRISNIRIEPMERMASYIPRSLSIRLMRDGHRHIYEMNKENLFCLYGRFFFKFL